MIRSLFLILFFPLLLNGIEIVLPGASENWEGDFTDYPVGEEKFYELSWGWENLPTQIDELEKGLFLSGNNHSDDLFMFARHKIEGLRPNTWYAVSFAVLIETNVFAASIGIGGSPGENVYFKVGASTEKPRKIEIDGYYHLNVDKGDQSLGGKNAYLIGDLANEAVDPLNPLYLPKLLTRENESLFVKSDSKGAFWIFLGTDSGFEGTTKFYLVQAQLHLQPFFNSG